MAESGINLFRLAQAQAENEAAASPLLSALSSFAGGVQTGIERRNAQDLLLQQETQNQELLRAQKEQEELLRRQRLDEEAQRFQAIMQGLEGQEVNTEANRLSQISEDSGKEFRRGVKIKKFKPEIKFSTKRGTEFGIVPTTEDEQFIQVAKALSTGQIDESRAKQMFPTRSKEIENVLRLSGDAITNISRGQDIGEGTLLQKTLGGGGIKQQSSNAIPKPGDIVAKGFDVAGRPTGFERVKKSAAQEKRDVESRELAAQTGNLVDLFVRARKEASSVPGFGSKGLVGRAAGAIAIGKGKIGGSPSVNIFQDRVPAFATIVAKAAGEVRPTDADIRRFVKSLINLNLNDEENAIQMGQILKDIQAKGQSIDWASPLVEAFQKETGTKVDINFQSSGDGNIQIMQDANGNRAEVEVDNAGNIIRIIKEL